MDMIPTGFELAPLPAFLLELTRKPLQKDRANVVPMPQRSGDPRISKYTRSALNKEIEAVRSATPGVRNDTLNRAAFALGQFVGSGELPRALVEQELYGAAES